MPIGSVSSYRFLQTMVKLRAQADQLQNQLGTGLRAETYAGLGTERTTSLAMRQRLSQIEAFDGTIATVQLRIKLLDTSLTRLGKIPRDIKGSLDPNAFEPRSDGYTDIQRSARISLDETITLLNGEIDGRYLFAGTKTDAPPVVTMQAMLDGSGERAGLRQLIAERRAADLGLNDGWISTSVTGATATFGWNADAPAGEGLRITAVTGSASTTVVTTDDGLPTETAAVTFNAVPAAGEAITVSLQDSAGNTTTLTLTAGAPPLSGNQFEIGADPAATAANFDRALRLAVSAAADADTTATVGGQVMGRLATTAAGSLVTVGKAEAANDVFGFTVGGATATGGIVVTNTGVGTPQATAGFDVTGPLSGGETVTLTLKNPQGADSVVTLTATRGPEVGRGQFLIDADPAVTAANFERALRAGISDKAKTELWASAAAKAADDFFDTEGGYARRIDLATGGGVAAFATAYRPDGTDTSADTVQWYLGQNDPIDPADITTQPRQGVVARIDRGFEVAYGVRANEEGLRAVVQNLALLVAETFPPNTGTEADTIHRERYAAFSLRARIGLTFSASEGPEDIHAQIAVAGQAAETVRQRNITARSTVLGVIEDVEGVDKNEAAAQLLAITNTLEATYAVTTRLSELTLVNFLR